jgi:hypothetical protein
MSDLASRLEALQPNRPGGLCKTCALLDKLPPEDAAVLRRLLAVPKDDPTRLSGQLIADTLTDEGHDVSEQSVSKHRRARHG